MMIAFGMFVVVFKYLVLLNYMCSNTCPGGTFQLVIAVNIASYFLFNQG